MSAERRLSHGQALRAGVQGDEKGKGKKEGGKCGRAAEKKNAPAADCRGRERPGWRRERSACRRGKVQSCGCPAGGIILAAKAAAPKPLSMFTTATPGTQEHSMVESAALPPAPTP